MRRHSIEPRPNWRAEVEQAGLIFHTHEGEPYWDESAYYEFTADEIAQLETASAQLHQMCLTTVAHIIEENRFDLFGINSQLADVIRAEWDLEPPTLYGRFDFGFDGVRPPKLFEYNADTPTSLLEAAVVQWQWLQARFPEADQFNSMWEGLIEQWTWLRQENKLNGNTIHFAAQDSWEDQMTVAVLRDTAHAAGLTTVGMLVEEIGWNEPAQEFRDLEEQPIRSIFKLYPWEFMTSDPFGELALKNLAKTQWIEPVWKMLLSNKALLAVLWELYPDHPNLLPAYLDGPRYLESYVVKPLLGREGSNVEIVSAGLTEISDGPYNGPRIWQGFYSLPDFDGNHPVIGSWIVGEDSRGIGIRETKNLITDDLARFVPHLFR